MRREKGVVVVAVKSRIRIIKRHMLTYMRWHSISRSKLCVRYLVLLCVINTT